MDFGDLEDGDKFWFPIVRGKGRFDKTPVKYKKTGFNAAIDKDGYDTGFLNSDEVRAE